MATHRTTAITAFTPLSAGAADFPASRRRTQERDAINALETTVG